jgi:hypothetical protein
MHPAMRSLYELQQLDRYIAELRRTLEKLDPGDHIREEIQRQRAILEQIKREYDALHAEAVDQELQLRQMDEKFREAERELYSDASRTRRNWLPCKATWTTSSDAAASWTCACWRCGTRWRPFASNQPITGAHERNRDALRSLSPRI